MCHSVDLVAWFPCLQLYVDTDSSHHTDTEVHNLTAQVIEVDITSFSLVEHRVIISGETPQHSDTPDSG